MMADFFFSVRIYYYVSLYLFGTIILLTNAKPTATSESGDTALNFTGLADFLKVNCSTNSDLLYDGFYTNCRERGIQFETLAPWFHANTTTLILDENNIAILRNSSFIHLRNLRNLSLSGCGISKIEVDAFKGLSRLESLNLENNNLPLSGYESVSFNHTPALRHLLLACDCNSPVDIDNNNDVVNDGETTEIHSTFPLYSKYIQIFSLYHLETLSIATFQVLYVDPQFSRFRNLTTLIFDCSILTTMGNYSFHSLQGLSLRTLHLVNGPIDTISLDYGSLQYLPNLTDLLMSGFRTGNHNLAQTFWPFVGKNMTSITLKDTMPSNWHDSPAHRLQDGILTKSSLKHIIQICVSHFKWTDSFIWTIDGGALANSKWSQCMKTIDLSGNPLFVNPRRTFFLSLIRFKSLQSITLSPSKEKGVYTPGYLEFRRHSKDKFLTLDSSAKTNYMNSYGRFFNVSLSLHILRISSIRSLSCIIKLNDMIHFINALQEIYVIDCPSFMFGTGRYLGFENLQLLDLSFSQIEVSDYFYDNFPNLIILALRAMIPEHYFDAVISCKRLLRNMTRLRYLDIGKNGLASLLPGTFSNTPHLEHLVLSENQFSYIPFSLKETPSLQILNLTFNSLPYLTQDEMDEIDYHAQKVPQFSIKLQGNLFSCVCSRIHFLAWLQTTSANLDNHDNYNCTAEDGSHSNTEHFKDIEAFWRQCQGRYWFMVSLVLASLMAVGFLTSYIGTRFRTAVLSHALRILVPQYCPRRPQDYRYDVFIGYADHDYKFVTSILQRELEINLEQRTYIHHRDLGNGYIDQLFFEAIQESWRVLLVITSNFLHRYDMANIIMKYASYAVRPENQGRVFVMGEESQLHSMPASLMAILDETRIIVIPDLTGPLNYQQRQNIKTCLLPVH